MPRIAMYQPDIPQNLGAMIRLAACAGAGLDVIGPSGFPWDDAKIRRAAMDYIHNVDMRRHTGWTGFRGAYPGKRVVLITTKSDQPYTGFAFAPDDILLLGQEGAGVPAEIHEAADARLAIPMRAGLRSLNVVTACAMVLGEALRQTEWTDENR
jgi:tRNA (cytidine/uridine-2'-O-)-methyltransferase